jgi:glutathione S-transferase
MSAEHKLYYYGIPGRGEQIRLAFHVAGIPLEDVKVTGAEWAAQKAQLLPQLPQANTPLLEVNGKYLTESLAILRYAGAIGGLLPAGPFDQGKVDAGLSLSADVFTAFAPTFGIADFDEKVAARQALCAPGGKIFNTVQCMDKVIAVDFSEGGFMAGGALSIGDINWFTVFGLLTCGMIDGFDKDFLDQFPNVTAFRKNVGTLPKVASRYANETEGLLFNGFKF